MRRRKLRAALLAVAALAVVAGMAGTAACTSWQSAATDVNIKGEDVIYLKDEKAGLCFAVLILANKARTSVSDMSMTSVPCEKLVGIDVR